MKSAALELAFKSFLQDEWPLHTERASQLAAFIARALELPETAEDFFEDDDVLRRPADAG